MAIEIDDLMAMVAAKQERWSAFREGWERYAGMDEAAVQIVKHFKANTINDGAQVVLTQGVDETINRMTGVQQNFAVTAALFMSAELGFLLDIPDGLETGWLYTYLASSLLALCIHTAVVVNIIHFLNWIGRFRCDAEFILYFLEHDWQEVTYCQMVKPLISGCVLFIFSTLLLLSNAFDAPWLAIPLLPLIAIPIGTATIIFDKHTAQTVFMKFQRYSDISRMEQIVAMYVEMWASSKSR